MRVPDAVVFVVVELVTVVVVAVARDGVGAKRRLALLFGACKPPDIEEVFIIFIAIEASCATMFE